MRRFPHIAAGLSALIGLGWAAACGAPLAPVITIDGSSTVYPLTEAVAEDFGRVHPGSRVTIGIAGTSGGLRRFCRGELAIANASRPMTPAEVSACQGAGVAFLEIPVAHDGITVVVHPSNTWVDSLTIGDLRRLWQHEAEGRVRRWSQVRDGWPDREVHLFGAGVDSGTFDYFTGMVTGAPRDSRGDYTSSEDDNLLVQGVASDPGALGYLGFAYYEEHRQDLRAVAIRAHEDAPAVVPTRESIRTGAYRPLARPVFLYVSTRAMVRPEVDAFLAHYLARGASLAAAAGYVPLDDRVRAAVDARVAARVTGSVFASADGDLRPVALARLLGAE